MKTIALFGGSFNPPHPGHFEAAGQISRYLGVDEIWFLFSNNPFKNLQDYASKEHRIRMCEILAASYPELPFKACDIEESIGSNRTYDVLTELKKLHPDHHFIWVMGADNLDQFHVWGNADRIIQENPIAVISRAGYERSAQESPTALKYQFMRVANPQYLKETHQGWSYIEIPGLDLSSSGLKKQISQGQRQFSGPFQQVMEYILRHQLYGCGDSFLPIRSPQ